MITLDMYKQSLDSRGQNLAQVRLNDATDLMNISFTEDIGYKRVYILNKDKGWVYEDAKFSKHGVPSILKDAIDVYLQFRPKVHYPIGTYVFIADDTSPDIGFSTEAPTNPFTDPNFNVNKLWMIVGRNDNKEFVRYNILKCNWNFRWVYRLHGEYTVMNVWGAVRNANSYTSGVWTADYSVTLDTITAGWCPDTHYIYGDDLTKWGFYDTRYIRHEERFMITNNQIYPQVYMVTKVNDMVPQGILKMTFKQVDLNPKTDNVKDLLCNYYETLTQEVILDQPDNGDNVIKLSYIWAGQLDEEGVLDKLMVSTEERDSKYNKLYLGKKTYFVEEMYDATKFYKDNQRALTDRLNEILLDRNSEVLIGRMPDDENAFLNIPVEVEGQTGVISEITGIEPRWYIELVNDQNYPQSEINRLTKMVSIQTVGDNVIVAKPAKASSLIGTKWKLTVTDENGDYTSSMILEVCDE